VPSCLGGSPTAKAGRIVRSSHSVKVSKDQASAVSGDHATVLLKRDSLRSPLPAATARGRTRSTVRYPRALTDLYLYNDGRAKARPHEIFTKETASAKRIAIRVRRKQAHDLGDL
jgi:hypothetical protein